MVLTNVMNAQVVKEVFKIKGKIAPSGHGTIAAGKKGGYRRPESGRASE